MHGLDEERQRVSGYLRAWGCQTEIVTSVREALDSVARANAEGVPFSLVLADCGLAKGDEYILLSKLSEFAKLPIIGLGLVDDEESIAYLRQLGVRQVLRHPVRPSLMFNAMASALAISDECGSHGAISGGLSDEKSVLYFGHVLVVEDNRINQMYVVESLTSFGCTCDIAANGKEAVLAVRLKHYDLVLMDCHMPQMDGFTAAGEIRRWEAEEKLRGRLPIIALTANALKGDRERCLASGMNDYLSKPVEGHQLRAVMEKFLPRSTAEACAAEIVLTK